jgi:hypothetical protein
VFLVLAIVVLVITLIGILVAIPPALLAYVVWAVGAAVAFLAIGDRMVGREDGRAKPLPVGAALKGGWRRPESAGSSPSPSARPG